MPLSATNHFNTRVDILLLVSALPTIAVKPLMQVQRS